MRKGGGVDLVDDGWGGVMDRAVCEVCDGYDDDYFEQVSLELYPVRWFSVMRISI